MGEEEPQQPTTTKTQAEVPCYFLCPISLQMMRDPVTLPTGITYDRDGIERWLLAAATCPLTKQPVPADCHPTPNHTLRRLIHSWCHLHGAGDGDAADDGRTEAADRARVATLVSRLHHHDATQDELLAALRELRDVAAESRRLVAAVPGAADALAAVLVAASSSADETESSSATSTSSPRSSSRTTSAWLASSTPISSVGATHRQAPRKRSSYTSSNCDRASGHKHRSRCDHPKRQGNGSA